jgi:hypothetical protein
VWAKFTEQLSQVGKQQGKDFFTLHLQLGKDFFHWLGTGKDYFSNSKFPSPGPIVQ